MSSCLRRWQPVSEESRGNPSHRGGAASISSFAIAPPFRAIACCSEYERNMPPTMHPSSRDRGILCAQSSKGDWTKDSMPFWFPPISCTTRTASHWVRSVGVAAYPCYLGGHISRPHEVATRVAGHCRVYRRSWVARSNHTFANSCVVSSAANPRRTCPASGPSRATRQCLMRRRLTDLDRLPFPDYSQFPWSKYPNTIVPIITGRGCGWGVCTFCSDVTSTAGRTFRSRSPENVLAELSYQNRRHGAKLFVFTDLKLNSDLNVWRALGREFQTAVPGARWIGAVHVGSRGEQRPFPG